MQSIPMLHPRQTPANPPLTLTFTVRIMNPADAVAIVGLVRDSYGDSYCYKQFYTPAGVIQANESGYLTSGVAVTDFGEIIGHMALLRTEDDPHIVEPVTAVVKTGYRNIGVLTKIAEYLYINRKPELFKEVTGIHITPVTKHVISQKQVYKHGFKDCGIFLGYAPDVAFRHINVEHIERQSLVLTYMYVEKPESIDIYPPQRHKVMVAKLFNNIGVSFKCRIPAKRPQDYFNDESVLKIKTSDWLGLAQIKVLQYGKNIISEIETKLHELCSMDIPDIRSIHLYLSLNDPLTYYLTPEFEKLGFFFAGIMPGTVCKDTLILQYLKDTKIDYDKILLVTETARELLSYVVENRELQLLRPSSTIKCNALSGNLS